MKKVITALCFVLTASTILNAQTTATSAARSSTPVIKADKDPKPAATYTVTDSKTAAAAPACCKKDGAEGKACCAGHTTASGASAPKSCSGASASPASCSKSATHSCSHATHSEKKPE